MGGQIPILIESARAIWSCLTSTYNSVCIHRPLKVFLFKPMHASYISKLYIVTYMYMYIHIYIYIYIYILYLCMLLYTCIDIPMCSRYLSLQLPTFWICMYVYKCTCIYVYMYMCMCVNMYMHMYICKHIYTYIYI